MPIRTDTYRQSVGGKSVVMTEGGGGEDIVTNHESEGKNLDSIVTERGGCELEITKMATENLSGR